MGKVDTKKRLIGIATDEEFKKARQRWRERVCPGLFAKKAVTHGI